MEWSSEPEIENEQNETSAILDEIKVLSTDEIR